MASVDKQPENVVGPAVAFDDVISRTKIGADVAHDLHPYQHDSVIMYLPADKKQNSQFAVLSCAKFSLRNRSISQCSYVHSSSEVSTQKASGLKANQAIRRDTRINTTVLLHSCRQTKSETRNSQFGVVSRVTFGTPQSINTTVLLRMFEQ